LIALLAIGFTLLFVRWAGALLMGTKTDRVAGFVRGFFGLYAIGAIGFAVMFATSGRYMDMPVPHFWLPLSAALLIYCLSKMQLRGSLAQYAIFTRCGLFNRHAIWILPLAALACLYGEMGAMLGGSDFIAMHPTLDSQIPFIAKSIMANHELLLWFCMCALFAVPFQLGQRLLSSAGKTP
jgi:hypothetical protein